MKLVFSPWGLYKKKVYGQKTYRAINSFDSYPDALAAINSIEKEHPLEYARIDMEGEDTCEKNFGSIILTKKDDEWISDDCISGDGVFKGVKFYAVGPEYLFKTKSKK